MKGVNRSTEASVCLGVCVCVYSLQGVEVGGTGADTEKILAWLEISFP